MNRLGVFALAGAMVALPAGAHPHHDGEIFSSGAMRVSHAWTVETSAMAHAVEVYMTIENTGSEPDRLEAASTGFSDDGILQATVVGDDGVLAVKEVASIVVAPKQTVTFQPGGIHLVLNDVKRALEGGDHFDLTLVFEKAGEMTIEVEIEFEDHEHDRVPAI